MRYEYIFDEFYWRNFFDGGESTAMFAAVAIVVAIAAFFAVCSVVMYILRSVGLYKLALNRGMSNPGLAWIPFIGMFRMGSVADDISMRQGSRTYFGRVILTGGILSFIFSGVSSSIAVSFILSDLGRRHREPLMLLPIMEYIISPIISLAGIAVFVITIIALNKIYGCYNPVHSPLWTVLSVFFPFLQPIFLFVLRNRMPAPDVWDNGPDMYYPTYDRQNGGYYPPRAPEPPIYPQQEMRREQTDYRPLVPREQYETPEYEKRNDDKNP